MIRRALFGLVALAALGCAAAAQTLTFPPLSGRVVDEAGIIDGNARDSVGRKLAEFESRTGAEIVVATVPSLQGTDIETYAVALANNWRLGQDGKNNGAILLIAPNAGKVAIQASEGLRDRLTDEVMLRIVSQTLVPRLAADDIAGGVRGGIDDMMWVLTGPPQRAASVPATQLVQATPLSSGGLNFPALSGRVVDEAGILDSAARAALSRTSSDLEAKSTDQLVVVTLRSLRGTSIEDYGYRLGRAWQIGQQGKNNGVLLIVAPNERKVRIEVGYGLEGTLTDAITKFIIENSILPRFKAGDFPGGIKRGAEDIVQVLTGDEEFKQRAAQKSSATISTSELIVMMIFVLVAGFIFINIMFGVYAAIRGILEGLGIVSPHKKGKKKSWFDDWVVTGGSSGGSSGSSWSGGSSGGGGFSGGGGSFGGGGGGSSFVVAGATNQSSGASARTGDGQVTITYDDVTDACPVAPVFQPDAMLGRPRLGNGIYNATGAGQTNEQTARPTRGKTWNIYVQNDGDTTDDITIQGPGPQAPHFNIVGYRLLVSVEGTFPWADITSAVVGGTFTLEDVPPGGEAKIQLLVNVGKHAPVGTTKTFLITATSGNDPTKADTVGAIMRIV